MISDLKEATTRWERELERRQRDGILRASSKSINSPGYADWDGRAIGRHGYGQAALPLHPNTIPYHQGLGAGASCQQYQPSDSGYASYTREDAIQDAISNSVGTYQEVPKLQESQEAGYTEVDSKTVYSDAGSLVGEKVDVYVSELARNLTRALDLGQLQPDALDHILGELPALLKTFACRIGHEAPSQIHRDIMFFLTKYRQ